VLSASVATTDRQLARSIRDQQISAQPRQSAVNLALPAFAAERRAAAPLLLIRCCYRSRGQTDGQTDGHRTVT